MAGSFPLSTVAVFTGGSCAAGVACFALDMTTTPPVAAPSNQDGRSGQHPRLPHHWPPVTPAAAAKSRHFCIAALRMLIPPFVAADGIRFVSTRGPSGVGSGKSFTPLSRMHWANLRAAVLLLGAPLVAREPRWLQVLARADGLLERRGCSCPATSRSRSDRWSSSPDASGSGNSLTPLSRMHSANFTACPERWRCCCCRCRPRRAHSPRDHGDMRRPGAQSSPGMLHQAIGRHAVGDVLAHRHAHRRAVPIDVHVGRRSARTAKRRAAGRMDARDRRVLVAGLGSPVWTRGLAGRGRNPGSCPGRPCIQLSGLVLPARIGFSICRRYAPARSIGACVC